MKRRWSSRFSPWPMLIFGVSLRVRPGACGHWRVLCGAACDLCGVYRVLCGVLCDLFGVPRVLFGVVYVAVFASFSEKAGAGAFASTAPEVAAAITGANAADLVICFGPSPANGSSTR